MSEIWGAVERDQDDIIFHVLDKQNGVMRQERLDEPGLLAVIEKGMVPPAMINRLMGLELPWFFLKDGMYIYLDGPACFDNPNYHPVRLGYQIELLMWEPDQPQAQPATEQKETPMKIYVAEFKGKPALSRYTVVKETAKLFTVERGGEQILDGYIRTTTQIHKEYDDWFDSCSDAIRWLIDQLRTRLLVLNAGIGVAEASIADLEQMLDRSAD